MDSNSIFEKRPWKCEITENVEVLVAGKWDSNGQINFIPLVRMENPTSFVALWQRDDGLYVHAEQVVDYNKIVHMLQVTLQLLKHPHNLVLCFHNHVVEHGLIGKVYGLEFMCIGRRRHHVC